MDMSLSFLSHHKLMSACSFFFFFLNIFFLICSLYIICACIHCPECSLFVGAGAVFLVMTDKTRCLLALSVLFLCPSRRFDVSVGHRGR